MSDSHSKTGTAGHAPSQNVAVAIRRGVRKRDKAAETSSAMPRAMPYPMGVPTLRNGRTAILQPSL